MEPELLEIHPRELKFVFELKKQSSISIHLLSNSDEYVAFKVKTTSPKKYCVRPNIGVVKPRSKYDFSVTMQAQRSAPPDFQCKDKFLIQSTVVPFGTSEEDITSEMFSKSDGKYIEEKKLKVVLVNPNNSPVLLPVNGGLKQDVPRDISEKEKALSGNENIPPPPELVFRDESFKSAKDSDETLKPIKHMDEISKSAKVMVETEATMDMESKPDNHGEILKPGKDASNLKVANDFKDSTSELYTLQSTLSEAEFTITKLTAERNTAIQEKQALKQELALLKQKGDTRPAEEGFPFEFVCMVALVSLVLGCLLNLNLL